MTKFRREQNHRWAENLAAGRAFWQSGDYEKFYRGDEFGSFPYPGIKILAAFWRIENMEMIERYSVLKKVLPLGKYEKEFDVCSDEFFRWFVDDVFEINDEEHFFDETLQRRIAYLVENEQDVVPENWVEQMADLQQRSENVIAGAKDETLLADWFETSIRYVIGYARNLIRQGTRAALFVKYNGKQALSKAVKPAVPFFAWNINRIFYQVGMPETGFTELGDVVDMGRLGMLSDQSQSPSLDEVKQDKTFKYTNLNTCQLYGFFDSTATFLAQEKGCTSDAYCLFCEGHGKTTMNFVCPPDRKPVYYLKEGLGYGGEKCCFVLETSPAEDDERAEEATQKIFMEEVAEYDPETVYPEVK